jgi:alkylated DNA repair dioxygenase AlkB
MQFTELSTQRQTSLLLKRRSLLILKGSARYEWQHGIAPNKVDLYDGQRIVRGRRVSLTFRTIIENK